MRLIELITELIWSSNAEDFLFLQKENTYFNYKLRLLLEVNNALSNFKDIKEINLPKDSYNRIDKIKFLSYKEEKTGGLKHKYFPNYRLYKLIDLIEDKGIKNDEVIEKYNQLKEYYNELKDDIDKDIIKIDELEKNIIKLDYKQNIEMFDKIKNGVEKLKDNKIVKNDESSKTKISLLTENLDKINKRNLIFKTKELNNMKDVLDDLQIVV